VKSETFLLDPAIPRLPGKNELLVGRDDTLIRIKEQIIHGSNPALSALSGLPGVGKKAVAIALTVDPQIRAHFPDGILWAELGPQPDPLYHLIHWGNLLGIAPSDRENITSRNAWDIALRTIIGQRRFLFIIDDAWSAMNALALQVGGPHCAYLLTTRQPRVAFAFAGDQALRIPELTDDDGLALLASYVPNLVRQEPQQMRTLVQTTKGLPLALVLQGSYLASLDFTSQPRQLYTTLAQLRTAQHRLHLSMPIVPEERLPNVPTNLPLSLHTIINKSDRQLSSQAHEALCALAVFPAKSNSFSEKAALAISQQPIEVIDELWSAGLLENSGPGRYTMHQIITDYARSVGDDKIALQRLFNYMTEYVQTSKQDSRALELESTNILAALEAARMLNLH
jgi:hypothetical protein